MSNFESNITTYFVETHEWDRQTGLSILTEYFRYESGVYNSQDENKVESQIHDTILSLQVF